MYWKILIISGGEEWELYAAKREWWVGEKKGGAAAKTRGLELKVDGGDEEKDMSRHNKFFS